jgi:hypothetical protein
MLLVVEVALALMLVIGAGLLSRTLYNLNRIDAGFYKSRLVTFSLTLPQATYRLPSSRLRTFQPLLEELQAVPGIQGANTMSGLPPDRPLNGSQIRIEGYTAPPGGPCENADYLQYVMSDYFETMGIPLVAGRGFQSADATGSVVVVNETFATKFWNNQNPIGRRVPVGAGDQVPWSTVVGVAEDVKQGGLNQKTGPEIYIYTPQVPRATPQTMNVVLRTALPIDALSQPVENIVREIDRTVPVVRFRGMNEVFAESIRRPRLLAELLTVFAGLALILAAIGGSICMLAAGMARIETRSKRRVEGRVIRSG